jgi:hypothetical protein
VRPKSRQTLFCPSWLCNFRPPRSGLDFPRSTPACSTPRITQHEIPTATRVFPFRSQHRLQQCCASTSARLCTDDDRLRRLWHSCRRIPGARRLEAASLESRESFLPLSNTATRWERIQRTQKRGLEFQAPVHACQCAGAAVVGGAVLGREGDVQWVHRQLQLGQVGRLGTLPFVRAT